MGSYNEELNAAGVLVDLGGLYPSGDGKRVRFSDGNPTVVDGPFPDQEELIAGYWVLQVESMDEAVRWANRIPFEALARI